MKKLRITGDSLKRVEEIDCGGNEELESFCIFCRDEFPSRFGRCPYCCGMADRYGDIKFEITDTKKELSIEFFCQCGANWVEHYQLNPLPITRKQDSLKIKCITNEQLNKED